MTTSPRVEHLNTVNTIAAPWPIPRMDSSAGIIISRQSSVSTTMLITTETSLYDVCVISASPMSIATQIPNNKPIII